MLSPYYVGAVHTLSATGGYGSYVYSQVSGGDAWTVNATTGAVSLVRAAGTKRGRQDVVFAVRDELDTTARFVLKAQFLEGRESDSRLYVVGGAGATALNDVWYSADGGGWDLATATAAFAGRYGHGVVSYRENLWLAGGYDGSKYFRDVWRSADGGGWALVTATAAFAGRHSHQMVLHDGNFWLVGGRGDDDRRFNDVWRSANGSDWVSVAISGPAFSGRSGHGLVSHGGSLWVVGAMTGRNWGMCGGRRMGRVGFW